MKNTITVIETSAENLTGYFNSIIQIRKCPKLSNDAKRLCQELWFTQGHGYHHSSKRIAEAVCMAKRNVLDILGQLQRVRLVVAYEKRSGVRTRMFYRLKLFQHSIFGDGDEPAGIGEMWLKANPGYVDVTKGAQEYDFSHEVKRLKKEKSDEWMKKRMEKAVNEQEVDW